MRVGARAPLSRSLRFNKECWLLYCGSEAVEEQQPPSGWHWEGAESSTASMTAREHTGCGALLCARALVEEEKAPGGRQTTVAMSDLPPLRERMGDGPGRARMEPKAQRPRGCRGCLTKTIACTSWSVLLSKSVDSSRTDLRL